MQAASQPIFVLDDLEVCATAISVGRDSGTFASLFRLSCLPRSRFMAFSGSASRLPFHSWPVLETLFHLPYAASHSGRAPLARDTSSTTCDTVHLEPSSTPSNQGLRGSRRQEQVRLGKLETDGQQHISATYCHIRPHTSIWVATFCVRHTQTTWILEWS